MYFASIILMMMIMKGSKLLKTKMVFSLAK